MLRSQSVRIVIGAASAALLVVAAPRAADALHHGPHVKITSPKKGAKVTSPVTVIAAVEEFKLVPAGTPLAEGEGHLHFFIDVPADNVKPGAMIPLDTLTRYIHLGKEPFDRRDLTLAPGKHTITVVAANSGHQRIKDVKPYSVTFTVTP
jgi:hypothetical protein